MNNIIFRKGEVYFCVGDLYQIYRYSILLVKPKLKFTLAKSFLPAKPFFDGGLSFYGGVIYGGGVSFGSGGSDGDLTFNIYLYREINKRAPIKPMKNFFILYHR